MSVTDGYTKYKRYAKQSDGAYKLISQWTSSNTVHFDDGNTAQTKVGAINGITDSLTATSSNVALSAAGGNSLQTQINTLNSNLISKAYVLTDGLILIKYGNICSLLFQGRGFSNPWDISASLISCNALPIQTFYNCMDIENNPKIVWIDSSGFLNHNLTGYQTFYGSLYYISQNYN